MSNKNKIANLSYFKKVIHKRKNIGLLKHKKHRQGSGVFCIRGINYFLNFLIAKFISHATP